MRFTSTPIAPEDSNRWAEREVRPLALLCSSVQTDREEGSGIKGEKGLGGVLCQSVWALWLPKGPDIAFGKCIS